MIVETFNASGETLWRWFEVPGGGQVELKLVSRDELTAMAKNSDLSVQARYVVKNCWRDFKEMKDANGVDIPNTEDNRAVMLTYRPLWNFVIGKLTDLGKWGDEGKDGSGSAS
jgi:hypothetical protein